MPLPEPGGEPELVPARVGTRAGRGAVGRRRSAATRARRRSVTRIFALLSVVTVAVVAYLALLANVARLDYALVRESRTRAVLQDETSLLDDRIARLESRDRLAKLAAQLHMTQPERFVQVALPAEPLPKRSGFGGLLGWLR